jgi:c-di-GMP-binding flagellar brake protein YcgR
MKNNNSTDRRIFARIPILLPLRFLTSGQDKESKAETIDVSANGIGLVSKKRLSPRSSLEMWLDLPNSQTPFYTRGEVVWSRASSEADKYRAGVHLERAELMGLAPVLWR